MKKTNCDLRKLGIDPYDTNSQVPKPACIDILNIIATLNFENSYHNKIRLINHVYTCHACGNDFKEYLTLLDKIDFFCNSSGHIFRAKQPPLKHIFNFAFLNLHFRSLIIIMFAVFIAGLLVFHFIPSERNNSGIFSVQMRGISSSIMDVLPKPFSSVSKVGLFFEWYPVGQLMPQGICLYDSDLELIWESNYSLEKKVLLPIHISGSLSKDHQYYWSIKTRAESGTSVYSILLPFSIKD